MKSLAENKKAFHEYEILETFEAGISLNGQEVKSIRLGRAQLQGSFVIISNERPVLLNSEIPAYQPKNAPKDYNSSRTRPLLLNKKEIAHLIGKSAQKGLTLVPLRLYTRQGNIKLEIGIAKNKSKADKRQVLKKRDIARDIQRELKERG